MNAPTKRWDRGLHAGFAAVVLLAVLIGQVFTEEPYLLRLPFALALVALVLYAGLCSDWVRR